MAGQPARLQPQQRAISITPCFIRFYVLRSAVVPFLHVCHLYYSLFMILQCPRFSVHSVVLGKAASSLDKNIDPLDCKVINRLIESSSTDRVFRCVSHRGCYSSKVFIGRTVRLGSWDRSTTKSSKGGRFAPDCPTERGRSVFHISQSRLVLEKKRRRYLARFLMFFLFSFFFPSFMCTLIPSLLFLRSYDNKLVGASPPPFLAHPPFHTTS